MSNESSYDKMSDRGSTQVSADKKNKSCIYRFACHRGTLCSAGFILGALTVVILGATVFNPNQGSGSSSSGKNSTSVVGCSRWGDVEKVVKIGAKQFLAHESTCGKSALGAKEKTAECMVKATGISWDCADCYGEQTACGALHCPLVCAFGADDKCTACVCKNCRAAFLKCNKLPCTLLPANDCKDCPGYQPF